MILNRESGIAEGVQWAAMSQGGRQAVQILVAAWLARLLPPSDFGLLGMCTVGVGFVSIFRDLGSSAALIQYREPSDELLSSVFWANIAFALLSTLALIGLAPLIADFYREPRVTVVMRVLSLNILLSAPSILPATLLQRTLAFKELAWIEVASVVSGAAAGIGSAWVGLGAWSLVNQTLASTVANTLLLWLAASWSPCWRFRWAAIRRVQSFSLNFMGFTVFNYFARNADNLLVGRYLGSEALGYYSLAYRIMLYPLQNISGIVSRVMFPVFSQMQSDDANMRRIYLKAVGSIALVSFPLMIGLMPLSKIFIEVAFGSGWNEVASLVLILSPVGMVQSISTLNGTLYGAKGRTDLQFRVGIVFGCLIMLSFLLGLPWGVKGVATGYVVIAFLLLYPSLAIPLRLIELRVTDLVLVLSRTLLSSLAMLGLLLAVQSLLPQPLSSGLALLVFISTGSLGYLLMTWWLNRCQLRQLGELMGISQRES